MKIGDYVRTKDGIILKIKDIEDIYTTDNIHIGMAIYDNEGHFVDEIEIIKSSSNIIDLIEVGDYVNGIDITEKYIDVNGNMIIKNECDDDYYSIAFENKDIKSIVTKEQFESIKYRIGK